MREIEDDIWAYHPHAWITITTNVGWNEAGRNIMGRGIAKDAADRFPDLPGWYGEWCKNLGEATPVMANVFYGVVLFPTKPLDANNPHLSWKQNSSLDLIERGLSQLVNLNIEGEIMLPLLGCGNGRLTPAQVMPLMEKYLADDRFILVHRAVTEEHPF